MKVVVRSVYIERARLGEKEVTAESNANHLQLVHTQTRLLRARASETARRGRERARRGRRNRAWSSLALTYNYIYSYAPKSLIYDRARHSSPDAYNVHPEMRQTSPKLTTFAGISSIRNRERYFKMRMRWGISCLTSGTNSYYFFILTEFIIRKMCNMKPKNNVK